jgi:hypothetical protein
MSPQNILKIILSLIALFLAMIIFLVVIGASFVWLREIMGAKDAILALATFFGPILSALMVIYITRHIDADRHKTERKSEIFYHLAKTRNFRLHADHVVSLNLVPVVFADNDFVMKNFKNYIEHLYKQVPIDQQEGQRFEEARDVLFGKLLVSIGRSLGMDFAADEMRYFGYMPNGWAETENEQGQVRKLLINVLRGLSPIAIKPTVQQSLNPPNSSLFPPPPPPSGQ